MLEARNITKRFGGVMALQSCSFKVEAEKITALVGPNGAGKTTLFDVVSGLVKPEEGNIILHLDDDEFNLISLRPNEIARLGISRTWQQVRLFQHLTIEDHLELSETDEDTKFFKNLFFSKSVNQGKHEEALKKFGIERSLDTIVSDLSYGQRKLLQLAMAVLQPHHLLLLDEPVAGVNMVLQKRIESLLLEMKEQGETMLIVEHDMEFVRRLADHVVVMDAGKVLIEGEPEAVLSNEKVIEAYLGA